ncbi:hypothetical protein L3X38_000671 [Prunus dulcis]|uniref:Uncharacterized protein n=1 Tax=Prunus dulcis TaxID=3755 RepID=A0AAD4ZJ69_PRUDU|nr:hypothetical protein L3X38_000671 [Prunus dulcis]
MKGDYDRYLAEFKIGAERNDQSTLFEDDILFGKNMRRAGFGPCSLQGTLHLIFVVLVILNCIAFIVTKKHCFIYLAIAFTISLGTYLGYFCTQMKNKFNIRFQKLYRSFGNYNWIFALSLAFNLTNLKSRGYPDEALDLKKTQVRLHLLPQIVCNGLHKLRLLQV